MNTYDNTRMPVMCILICVMSIMGLKAQNVSPTGKQIYLKSHAIALRGDSVWVDLEIEITKLSIGEKRQLVLTPMLVAGERNRALPPVVINGRKRDKVYRRELSYSKNNLADPYTVVKVDNNEFSQKISYRVGLPVESWMKSASFVLEQDLCGCGGEQQQISVEMIAQQFLIIHSPVLKFDYNQAAVTFIEPPKEAIKKRNESNKAYIVFKAGQSVIIPELSNNLQELGKIIQSLNYIKEEPSARITGARISAYASPEGSRISNHNLSGRRAEALTSWLRRTQNLKDIHIDSNAEGEDWNTLLELLKADLYLSREDKELIERVISSTDDWDARERELLAYKRGNLFRYLSDNIFPQLRRCDYLIEFTVPEFSLEKSKELLKSKPGMLSLAEFYAIANTYEKGSEAFNNLFDIAVRLFPEDPIAGLNAAAAEIHAGELNRAERRLEALKDDPRAWNNIGVLFMKKHRIDEAEEYLKKALQAGNADARKNLELIPSMRKEQQRYNEALKEYQLFKDR